MNTDKEVIVVNPKKKESLELNYRSLTNNVKFIYNSFEELIENKNLMEEIFS